MISVLRMKKGEEIQLTNGKGKKAKAIIADDNRKKCVVQISDVQMEAEKEIKIAIGISLIKNASRFEWFLEKATEIGISEIIPLICERTEKEKFRDERFRQILVSAMLQSQQSWLPALHEPMEFDKAIELSFDQKFIAHCLPENKTALTAQSDHPIKNAFILIGPEGDFTRGEIDLAIKYTYKPVSLGNTRLRTETAGIVAAVLLSSR